MIVAIIKNFMELGIPCITSLIKRFIKRKLLKVKDDAFENEKLVMRIEQQLTLGKYAFKEIDGTYYDYLEMMLQLGYVSYFSLAFPLSPLLAFINNILEV